MRDSTLQLKVWPRVEVKMNRSKTDRAYLSIVETRPKPVVHALAWAGNNMVTLDLWLFTFNPNESES